MVSIYSLFGVRIYQYLSTIGANFAIINSELHYGWPSPFIPVLESGNYTVTISSEMGSWLTVTHPIGSMFGAMFAASIVDIIGRKKLVVLSSIPAIANWLVLGLASVPSIFFVGRFMSGFLDGISFTVVPMYVGEISEPQIRGLLSSAIPTTTVIGFLIINSLGAYLPLDTVSYICTIIPVLLLVTFSWMPESPYYFLIRGNIDAAKRSLQQLRGTKDVNDEFQRIAEAVRAEQENKGSFFDLFTVKSNRKAVTVTLGLFTIQQFSGRSVIIFYCKTIFEQSHTVISAETATILYFAVMLFFSVVTSIVVDFFGRRPMLILSVSCTAMALLTNSVFLYLTNCTNVDTSQLTFMPIVALIGFVVTFSLGLQTIPHLIMGEIFATSVKAFALCLMDIYNSIVETISSKYFHWTNDTWGLHVPFFSFFTCCILGLFFVIFYVPETKGKTLEAIQDDLKERDRVPGSKKNSTLDKPRLSHDGH
ncbi:unnamed protein product [Acanthoscelides obtectus]|uniref:Major facilitator superfamily (MFS) profile domain-containing protein n=3 Tax=Acanthoscelides obtectus TaxID=200917 RepID=A0A9P0K8Y1_ACAOB|nr:unnamed protein product [Acanthoscelides obtectus]CAK1655491.1 Facilitated trehalose transporter Tret1 [Acanthoscelides obtectus]